ncbi:MAG: GTP pyrophosphokinase family protein [Ruminococcaceae bacterium]|nr:GTP pyrophosphokinase family protein [Oscillospiraceae bacterium]
MSEAFNLETQEEWTRLLLMSKFGIDEVETKLNIINDEYHFLHAYNPIEHIISRNKSPQNIMEKLRRMGLEPTLENAKQHLNDIGGIRVICSVIEDVYTIAEQLERQNDITVLTVKDYIKHPKPNGYRSYHMIVEVPVFLTDRVTPVKIEVQIRTVAMDLWASLEHKIYYKSGIQIPKELQQEVKQVADAMAAIDQRLCSMKSEISKYTT